MNWIPCGYPGCMMLDGHVGPHYGTAFSGNSAGGTYTGPWIAFPDQSAEIAALLARAEAAEAGLKEAEGLVQRAERLLCWLADDARWEATEPALQAVRDYLNEKLDFDRARLAGKEKP